MKNNVYAFDLECTSKEPSHAYMLSISKMGNTDINKVSMVYKMRNHETTIKDIVNKIFSYKNGSVFYAHNLKYDISFILSYLFKNFKEGEDFIINRNLIMPMTKSFISITIIFNGKKIIFKDSFTLFTAPLAAVMKAYTTLEKGETPLFDYADDIEITEDIVIYSKVDSLALGIALEKRLELGEDALTTASGAFKEFKKTIDSEYGKGNFHNVFPIIPEMVERKMRGAYRGGFTYLNPDKALKTLEDIKIIDVNSMYPAQMATKVLPYGIPKIISSGKVETTDLYNLGIQRFSVKAAKLRDGFIPFISTKNTFIGANQYNVIIDETSPIGDRTFSLTLQEFELFKRSYHVTGLEYLGGYLFKGRKGMFKTYLDKFWSMKMSENPTIKALGKLFLNALYGKFAEGYEKISLLVQYNDKITFSENDREVKEVGYLPMGIFITSYSRLYLIESILKIGVENFIYTDTDSIHYQNFDITNVLEIHDSDIGKWSYKTAYKRGYYIRAKRYAGEHEDGSLEIATAGIKKSDVYNQVLSLDDFRVGKPIKTIEFKYGSNGLYTRDKEIRI